MVNDSVHLEMTKVTFPALVESLGQWWIVPSLDMTDLKGTYQIELELPVDDVMLLAQKQAATAAIPGLRCPRMQKASAADAASTPGGSAIFAADGKARAEAGCAQSAGRDHRGRSPGKDSHRADRYRVYQRSPPHCGGGGGGGGGGGAPPNVIDPPPTAPTIVYPGGTWNSDGSGSARVISVSL